MAIEGLVTPAFVARMKKCSRGTVYAAIRKGELRHYTVLGRIGLEMADVRGWDPAPYRSRALGTRKTRGPGRPRLRQKSDPSLLRLPDRRGTGAVVLGYGWLLGCGTDLISPQFAFGEASSLMARRDFLPAP
jgi:hypothetical protein